jgi:hypothetical protein
MELYDFHARMYDPVIGRWLVPDPAEQHYSLYLAMGNNPMSMVDPDGMWAGDNDYYLDQSNNVQYVYINNKPDQIYLIRTIIYQDGFFDLDYLGGFNEQGDWWNGDVTYDQDAAYHKMKVKLELAGISNRTYYDGFVGDLTKRPEMSDSEKQDIINTNLKVQAKFDVPKARATTIRESNESRYGRESSQAVMGGGVIDLAFKMYEGRDQASDYFTAGLSLLPFVGRAAPLLGKVGGSAARTGGSNLWRVGAYNEIKGLEIGLDAHHVGQKALMKKFVPGYNANIAPSILVPEVGHTIRGVNGIVSRSTTGIANARQLLARDIFELRRVYGGQGIPNSSLQQLIQMNKTMYPGSFIK